MILTASCLPVFGQIDPEKRQLFQLGYNQPIEGRAPIAGYLFYYLNQPNFLRTNLTLRLAAAPIYLDSELGIKGALGARTDLGIGVAGGGFADSYYEMRSGKFLEPESFTGHGAEVSMNLYHRFNPSQQIPLSAIFRISPRHSIYERDSDTGPNFQIPEDRTTIHLRSGLRLGGKEPTMDPELAMELSVWYEGQIRTEGSSYGFAGDRRVNNDSHLFWARALLNLPLPYLNHPLSLNLTAGTSIHADRFSGYRLGGNLPLASEFPLALPGYYYQEISARKFVLFSGNYSFPLDQNQDWVFTFVGSVGGVDYLDGFQQPGHLHSGAGAFIRYRSPMKSWQVALGYGYGFNAVRNGGTGAQSLGLWCQWDLEAKNKTHQPPVDPQSPYKSKGLFRFLGR